MAKNFALSIMTHIKDTYRIKQFRNSKGIRIFAKHKTTKFREPTLTDAEIDEIREKMGIKLNVPNKGRMGGHRGAL